MLSADASPPVDHAGLHRRDRAEEYFVRGVRKACGANRRRHHRNCSEVCAHLGVLPAWQHNPKWLGGDLGARLNARWVCKRSHDNKHGERTAVSASYATPPQITKARLPTIPKIKGAHNPTQCIIQHCPPTTCHALPNVLKASAWLHFM